LLGKNAGEWFFAKFFWGRDFLKNFFWALVFYKILELLGTLAVFYLLGRDFIEGLWDFLKKFWFFCFFSFWLETFWETFSGRQTFSGHGENFFGHFGNFLFVGT